VNTTNNKGEEELNWRTRTPGTFMTDKKRLQDGEGKCVSSFIYDMALCGDRF